MYIKFSFKTTTKKVKVDDSVNLENLRKELVKCFGESAKNFVLSYQDAEKDTVIITTQDDWSVCMDELNFMQKDKPIKSLLLTVHTEDDFVPIGNSRVEDTVTEEIKEEKKQEKAPVFQEKVIEEVKPTEVVSTPVVEKVVVEEVKPTPLPEVVPEPEKITPAFASNIVEQLTDVLGSLGIQVDSVEATVEPTHNEAHNSSVSSTLSNDMKDEIESMIEEKIQRAINLKKAAAPKIETAGKNFTHRGIVCDGCSKGIHNMARFKSLVKPDFDLCEECEAKGIHEGPMVKFNTPTVNPPHVLEKKFHVISKILKGELNQETKPEAPAQEFEGFRFPRHGGCPFRGGRFGGHPGAQQNPMCHIRQMIPGFLQGVKEVACGVQKKFQEELSKASQANQTKMEEPKPASKEEQIAQEVNKIFPNYDVNVLKEIIVANSFQSAPQLIQYLFDSANC